MCVLLCMHFVSCVACCVCTHSRHTHRVLAEKFASTWPAPRRCPRSATKHCSACHVGQRRVALTELLTEALPHPHLPPTFSEARRQQEAATVIRARYRRLRKAFGVLQHRLVTATRELNGRLPATAVKDMISPAEKRPSLLKLALEMVRLPVAAVGVRVFCHFHFVSFHLIALPPRPSLTHRLVSGRRR